MKIVADCIAKATFDYENSADAVDEAVAQLCARFPLYE